jgi:hypothetical protein
MDQERLKRMQMTLKTTCGGDDEHRLPYIKKASQTVRSKINPYVTNLTADHSRQYMRVQRKKVFMATKGSL